MTKTNPNPGKLTFWAIVQPPSLSFALDNVYHNIRGACEQKQITKRKRVRETECGILCSLIIFTPFFVLQRIKFLLCLMSLQVLRLTGRLPIFQYGVEIPFFLNAWWIHSRKGWLCFLLYHHKKQTLNTISFHVILGYFHNCVIFLPGGTQVTGVKTEFCT